MQWSFIQDIDTDGKGVNYGAILFLLSLLN